MSDKEWSEMSGQQRIARVLAMGRAHYEDGGGRMSDKMTKLEEENLLLLALGWLHSSGVRGHQKTKKALVDYVNDLIAQPEPTSPLSGPVLQEWKAEWDLPHGGRSETTQGPYEENARYFAENTPGGRLYVRDLTEWREVL